MESSRRTFFNWLNITPRVGGRLTYYSSQNFTNGQRNSDVYREVFGSSMYLAQDALQALGKSATDAARIVNQFRTHDEKYLRKAAKLQGDQSKLVDLARASRIEIGKVFASDKDGVETQEN